MSRTLWVITLVIAFLVVYDVWTIVRYGYETTISAELYDFVGRFSIVGVAFGVVIGHLWWPNEHACKRLAERKEKP